MLTLSIPFRHIRLAACVAVLALGSAACSTPAPVAKPRPQATRILPSVALATMIRNMQVPADQVSYFDQAGKALTPEAFAAAIDKPAGPEYNVKATRSYTDGVWTAAAEVHLVDRAPLTTKAP